MAKSVFFTTIKRTGSATSTSPEPVSSAGSLRSPVSATMREKPFFQQHVRPRLHKVKKSMINYGKFIGPGFMIAVAYSTYYPLTHSRTSTQPTLTTLH